MKMCTEHEEANKIYFLSDMIVVDGIQSDVVLT